ncbi:MAG: adaptor protein MecA [Ruminococcus sp.]|nr:adaptor protein MecA [Ruminococcus sp.]
MHSEHIGKNALKITLTAAELKASGLSQKELLSRDKRTSDLVNALVQRLSREGQLPRGIIGEHLTAEVISAKDNGCIVYVTCETPTPEANIPKYAAAFFSMPPLLRVCSLLYSRHSYSGLAEDVSLWANRAVSLLIFPLSSPNIPLADDIRQYAPVIPLPDHSHEKLSEHFTLILEQNAPEILLRTIKL